MKHVRISGRRLAAVAVTVVLAATGGTLTALPAVAAPAATKEDPQQTTVAFPLNADVVGAGPSGFLSKTRGNAPEFRWTRYADGSSTVLPGAAAAGGGADLVVTGNRALLSVSSVIRIHDVSKPAVTSVEIDLDALGDYDYSGLADDTLLLGKYEGGYRVQYAATLDEAVLAGGTPKLRKLVGGPLVDCAAADEAWTDTASALYDCSIGETRGPAKIHVDLATGAQSWHVQEKDQWAWDGGGWGIYDRVVSVGNVAGGSEPDSIARDRSGALWLYRGTGDRNAPLAGRTSIGGGWQIYDRITGGSDVTGDGRSDVLASDKSGALWLYPGTGNANAPFSARKKIGGGWGIYNEITAVGDLAGAPAGDLLARDKAGVLWLYLGKGDGTFAARTRVGAGWGTFAGLTAVGDANGDGRADLLAWNGDETFYAGTGDWRAPFEPGARVSLTQDSSYGTVF
ncbi:VCBS repeat-containing protein [Streptomyces sp. NPDC026092]|uniref:FG-GAP repeat domain-containing protein n=1 Tax=Streptomyces sp. NPDC026092 TaxID=3154797 RepID=UPI0033E877FF